MSRFLANGIPTTIVIYNKNGYEKEYLTKNKSKILNELNKMIDITKYDCIEEENSLVLEINRNFFNKNIHELIKEMHPIMDCHHYFLFNLFDKKNIDYENFNNNTYKIELEKHDENFEYKNEYEKRILTNNYFIRNDNEPMTETLPFYSSEEWLFKENNELAQNTSVQTYFIMIWFDANHLTSEDETMLLYLLNKFSRNQFKNELAKNSLFFIEG